MTMLEPRITNCKCHHVAHPLQIDPQKLHRQLRQLINRSAETLRATPRAAQVEGPFDANTAHYEPSGLYLMVDPETGKPMGGTFMRPDQVDWAHDTITQHWNPAESDQACTSQRNSSGDVRQQLGRSSRHAASQRDCSADSVQPSAADSASAQPCQAGEKEQRRSDPEYLLTPVINQARSEQPESESESFEQEVPPEPRSELSITSLAASCATKPISPRVKSVCTEQPSQVNVHVVATPSMLMTQEERSNEVSSAEPSNALQVGIEDLALHAENADEVNSVCQVCKEGQRLAQGFHASVLVQQRLAHDLVHLAGHGDSRGVSETKCRVSFYCQLML
jgi:hypothetical protein